MNNASDLKRFIEAQEGSYTNALNEIRAGRKRTHWMWFMFPQLIGLGFSETSKFYSITDVQEAEAYLNDPILGTRLFELCNALLELPVRNAHQIFGSPDDLKLKSCMTLFASLDRSPIFEAVLVKYFNGEEDPTTLRILSAFTHGA